MQNDILNELGTNFIEYAVACNTDRAIPNANDGLKPVAKRILYGAYLHGFKSDKPHVKCANLVGQVMGEFHPHGDSSIYGALVRLSQNWVMRYPLIDFHGSNGNIDGDGPAAYRYTESRLSKLAEDGMLCGIKKNNVDFTTNYSETLDEPIELPSIFPNLLCNPNNGIGVAIACSWAPHNLIEVAQAINDRIAGKNDIYLAADFPTGGTIINAKDIPTISKTGHGTLKLRGNYIIENNNIVFTELPYGTKTEEIMTEIGKLSDTGEILGITNVRNESNKKGFRLVIECDKHSNIDKILKDLFAKTDLQTSFSYNQVALVDKTPTELNLNQCLDIYINYNKKCIIREAEFDIIKTKDRLHIIAGLLKALSIIDELIKEIKQAESPSHAKSILQNKYNFSDKQAQAILDMKLSKLSHLEKATLENEQRELNALLITLEAICNNPIPELQRRLAELVKKYGDARRTKLENITIVKEKDDEPEVEPEKCVVVITDSGLIKRIPATSFKTQKRNGVGVKTQDDITSMVIRTNTVDSLMIFTNKGMMYRLLVDKIPVGTNISRGTSIKSLIEMQPNEEPTIIYSIYKDTEAKYVVFITKEGLIKRTALDEFTKTKKSNGIIATALNDGDELVSAFLATDEDVFVLTKKNMGIRFSLSEVTPSSRIAHGVKAINLAEDDNVRAAAPVRHETDSLAIFSEEGNAKKIPLSEITKQKRAGKGMNYGKIDTPACVAMLSDEDTILIVGDKTSLCVKATDIPTTTRIALGVKMIKNSKVVGVSKV